jgi:membrane-associated phospholipid phosphatase
MTQNSEPSPPNSPASALEAVHVPAIPPPRCFFAMSLGMLLFFATWTWFTFRTDAIEPFDQWCAQLLARWTSGASHSTLTSAMIYLTDIGGVPALTLMAIMGAIWQTAINHRRVAIAWVLIFIGGALINSSAKQTFNRDRPPEDLRHRAVLETNKSYPSGHAMGSAVGYGLLAYALILPQRHRPRRIAALLLTGGMILGVGFSRIYLRAHWCSDVVGGWAIGLCWLFFCIGWLEMRRRKFV